VEWIRARHPEIKLRTAFITGFPGESKEDFAELEAFVAEGHFASVGVFCYSNEEGSRASSLPDQIAEELKQERRERLMRAQQKVVAAELANYVGASLEVLMEGPHPESELLLCGRTRFQAPEVDGVVIINDCRLESAVIQYPMFCRVQITEVAGYDLLGTLTAISG
jgi:ribosomal protein S12 methylthiotransferase